LWRHSSPGRDLWLLLDEAPCPIAPKSQARAKALPLELLWLPKHCSELNALEQLWRGLKQDSSANYQFTELDAHATCAQAWLSALTNREALRKAGICSKHFWLRSFL
jgi:transposase